MRGVLSWLRRATLRSARAPTQGPARSRELPSGFRCTTPRAGNVHHRGVCGFTSGNHRGVHQRAAPIRQTFQPLLARLKNQAGSSVVLATFREPPGGSSSRAYDQPPRLDEMDSDRLRSLIAGVNKAFYARVYRDPWLKVVFQGRTQQHLEAQQTDFMVGAFGGPKTYAGRMPSDAHPHIFIDESMWQLRESMLRDAFAETGLPEEMQRKWMRIDEAFKQSIIKHSVAECRKRFATDTIIALPDPVVRTAR